MYNDFANYVDLVDLKLSTSNSKVFLSDLLGEAFLLPINEILETLIEILVVPKLNLVPAGREFIPSIKVTRTLAFQAVAG